MISDSVYIADKIKEAAEKAIAYAIIGSTLSILDYEAFDIFDKLHLNQRAAIVEKKMELRRTVMDIGLPEIRAALLEGGTATPWPS